MPKTKPKSPQIFWIILPAALWVALFCLRPVFFHPWCAVQPTPCTVDSVNSLDQLVFHFHSLFADFLSNLLQNAVGLLMVLLPIVILRNVERVTSLELILLTGTFWNGALLELARTLAQRPRPLVMNDPMGDGLKLGQYTSFYSGHTSFVAFAGLSTFLWMRVYFGKSDFRVRITGVISILLVLLTASLRVLGGRHFPTDTLVGAIAGVIVALVVWSKSSSEFTNQIAETPTL
jgi:membrane-associated phospholipid phosphatase